MKQDGTAPYMKRGDLVMVVVHGTKSGWPPPDEFIGIYISPDHECATASRRHLVMFDGGVWTTAEYQMQPIDTPHPTTKQSASST